MSDSLIPLERIVDRILLIRGHRVILDRDLANLYGVDTKTLNRAVKRNLDRFPSDFMYQLSIDEVSGLRYQFGTSNDDVKARGGRRYFPYAFTEQGVAMLSSVLRSKEAVAVNIEVMRAFVEMRRMAEQHKDLAQEIKALDHKWETKFTDLYQIIKSMILPPDRPKRQIGFRKE